MALRYFWCGEKLSIQVGTVKPNIISANSTSLRPWPCRSPCRRRQHNFWAHPRVKHHSDQYFSSMFLSSWSCLVPLVSQQRGFTISSITFPGPLHRRRGAGGHRAGRGEARGRALRLPPGVPDHPVARFVLHDSVCQTFNRDPPQMFISRKNNFAG